MQSEQRKHASRHDWLYRQLEGAEKSRKISLRLRMLSNQFEMGLVPHPEELELFIRDHDNLGRGAPDIPSEIWAYLLDALPKGNTQIARRGRPHKRFRGREFTVAIKVIALLEQQLGNNGPLGSAFEEFARRRGVSPRQLQRWVKSVRPAYLKWRDEPGTI